MLTYYLSLFSASLRHISNKRRVLHNRVVIFIHVFHTQGSNHIKRQRFQFLILATINSEPTSRKLLGYKYERRGILQKFVFSRYLELSDFFQSKILLYTMRFFSIYDIALFGALATANPLIQVLSSRDTSAPESSSVVPSYTVLNNYCENAGPKAVSLSVSFCISLASQFRIGCHFSSTLIARSFLHSSLDS